MGIYIILNKMSSELENSPINENKKSKFYANDFTNNKVNTV